MTDLAITNAMTNAMTLAQSAPVTAPQSAPNEAAARKAASEFEGVFISQMLGQMFEGISTDGPFGGGEGEAMFRSLMVDEYGKQIAAQGGLGLADSIVDHLMKGQQMKAQLLKQQEQTP